MGSTTNLTMAAARLARSAPSEWNKFLEAFRDHSAAATQNCIKSTLEELPRNQGRAQTAAHHLELFTNCIASADKLEGTKR